MIATTHIMPGPGLHRGVPFAAYKQWAAVNQSLLAPMRRSALHCKHAIDNPREETDALALGKALHTAVFEPAAFVAEIVTAPACDRRTTAGKADYAAFVAAAAGKTIVSIADHADMFGMAAAIREHPAAAPFLGGAGENELSMLWFDKVTGLACKGRADRVVQLERPTIVELKTTRNASRWSFGKAIHEYTYHLQAAWYCNGYAACTSVQPDHVIVAVENTAPYAVGVYILNDQSKESGVVLARKLLDQFAACKKSGKWPSYSERVEVIDIPAYSMEDEVLQ